jgi:hypothetical protein
MNNEDWWRLVYEDGRLFVEHEWAHTDVQGRGGTQEGKVAIDLEIFLHESGQGEQHRELTRILDEVFNPRGDARTQEGA